jgi:Transposase IS66 family/IS66 C-terminal element
VPDKRTEISQAEIRPVVNSLDVWLSTQLPDISGKSPLASAIRYALTRMARRRPSLEHGILELDNAAAERAMRALALGRKNHLFVGSQTGGKSAVIAYILIETAKLNGVNRKAWLAGTPARIPDHKINRIEKLLPSERTDTLVSSGNVSIINRYRIDKELALHKSILGKGCQQIIGSNKRGYRRFGVACRARGTRTP